MPSTLTDYELLESLVKAKMPVDERIQYELKLLSEAPTFIPKSFLQAYQHVILNGNVPKNVNECHSEIAYNLGITTAHPGIISFHYPVNPGDLPDIDTDFAFPNQVKEYIRGKYGAERVIGIPTYGRYKFRALLQDLCRVVVDENGERIVPLEVVNEFNKKLPKKIDQQVSSDMADDGSDESGSYEDGSDENGLNDDELFTDPEIQAFQRKYPRVFDHFKRLYALPKYRGRHAAGMLILPMAAKDSLPLSMTKNAICSEWTEGQGVSELGKMGYIKIDLLGLKTLKVLDTCNKLIMERYPIDEETKSPCACLKEGKDCRNNYKLPMQIRQSTGEKLIDLDAVCLNIPKVYKSIREGNTQGIFQFEPTAMTQFTKKYGPKRFYDLALITALFRPGPLDARLDELGMPIDPELPEYKYAPSAAAMFIERYNGRAKVYYPSDKLESVLAESYGIAVFQEDISRVVMQMTACSFAEAEKIRKFLTKVKPEALKSNPEVIAQLKGYEDKFTLQSLANGCNEVETEAVWQLIVPFARYGFNKAHAVTYSLISFQTAFFRTLFPLEYLTSLMIHNVGKADKLVQYIRTAQKLGFKVLPPDLNTSCQNFTINKDNQILSGFEILKGMGTKAADEIVSNRTTAGLFTSLEDFLARNIIWRRLNVGSLQVLVKGGAFDFISPNRALTLAKILIAKNKAKRIDFETKDIFSDGEETTGELFVVDWSDEKKDEEFREVFGFLLEDFITKNKERVERAMKMVKTLVNQNRKDATCGTVTEIKVMLQKNGEKYARISATNIDGLKEDWLVFSSVWSVFKTSVHVHNPYICVGKMDDKGTFIVDSIRVLSEIL